jgi:DegV family protein with EDD domain
MVAYLDGPRLRRALGAGLAQLIGEEDLLNRINVFPVADGDTGTNLALTARAMIGALQHSTTVAIGDSLTELADAALDGCRGNSGAILAQFLHGLSDAAGAQTRLNPHQWVEAMGVAVNYARDAIERPREGTMLTILDVMHTRSRQLLSQQPAAGYEQLITPLAISLESALQATKTQLDVLAKANVVDAGAAGIVAIVQGINNLLQGAEVSALPDMTAALMPGAGSSADETYRFCTECIVTGTKLSHRRLREPLTEHGNSMVVAGGPERLKLHIHTDTPETIFGIAAQFGSVSGQKADDMTRQTTALQSKAGVAIITDSAGDLPQTEADRLNIHTVPLRVHIGEHSYLDKVSLSFKELYRKVSNSDDALHTSQPPPGDFRRMFEYLDSHFDAVVSVQLTDKVSGTLQAARAAADRLDPGHGVRIVNSHNISLGQGLLTLVAAECAADGQSADDIVATLNELIPKTRTFGIVTDLSYAVRGGRVPASRKLLADFLHVTPVLYNDSLGHVKTNRILWGRNRILHKFARHVARRCDSHQPYRIAVGHGNDPEQAQQLLKLLLARIPHVGQHYITEIGAALGVHGGPGMLVAAVLPMETT